MNTTKAKQIASRISNLAEIATRFYARYGHHYHLSADSPAQAWEMYRVCMAEQATIASLLDADAVDNPYSRYERWWERRDVINSGLINEMASEATRLVERTAYMETVGKTPDAEHSLRTIQQSIAGMLHPATRRRSIDRDDTVPEAI